MIDGRLRQFVGVLDRAHLLAKIEQLLAIVVMAAIEEAIDELRQPTPQLVADDDDKDRHHPHGDGTVGRRPGAREQRGADEHEAIHDRRRRHEEGIADAAPDVKVQVHHLIAEDGIAERERDEAEGQGGEFRREERWSPQRGGDQREEQEGQDREGAADREDAKLLPGTGGLRLPPTPQQQAHAEEEAGDIVGENQEVFDGQAHAAGDDVGGEVAGADEHGGQQNPLCTDAPRTKR